jgi:hypothetical protein
MAARSTTTRPKTSGRKKSTTRKKTATTARKKSTTARKKSSARTSTGRKKSTSSARKTTTSRKTSARRKYSTGASESVRKEMEEFKHGTARSGRKGGKVKSRKQAIAIGLSEARQEGEKVPPNPNQGGRKKSS